MMAGGNVPALLDRGHEVEWIIHTKKGEKEVLEKIIEGYIRSNLSFSVEEYDGTEEQMFGALIRKVINRKMILASPDMYFGNGAIDNLVKCSEGNNFCIAVPHIRVNDKEFIDRIGDEAVSNPELVAVGMGCLHRSWSQAFIDAPTNNCTDSGSFVRSVAENLWVSTFRIPTLFLVNIEESDLKALESYYYYDHRWPEKLIAEKRFKYIGSSDVFFAVELTSPNNNVPQLKGNSHWNDTYKSTLGHCETNRNFLVTMRGQHKRV